ncbi:MAG: acetoacetate--CoA ligase [Deltaproteobacteria bacterium]|nr:acetoacetate--CoA ligase [Deltaproteobacteria bacterium]
MEKTGTGNSPLWTPSPERMRGSNMHAFFQGLRARRLLPDGISPTDFPALHRWSVENLEAFWEQAWRDMWLGDLGLADPGLADPGLGEPDTKPPAGSAAAAALAYSAVLTDHSLPADRSSESRVWFPGARLNFAQKLLRYNDDHTALIAEAEGAPRRSITYAELHRLVARVAAGLKRLGVGPGDRVAGFLPNTIETVAAMLGATCLGAVWSSTSPDFGFQGVMDRFGQIHPKVLFCADGYRYNGKTHASLEKAGRLLEALPSLERLVLVGFLEPDCPPPAAWGSRGASWNEFLGAEDSPPPEYPALGFDHPVYIMYSSGTTGAPKCIVHGAGGTLLKHHTELKLHTGLGRDDVLFYFTTCGWMMWNWLVGGLACGATLVLYDGSPMHPEPERLFRLARENRISVFGTSPKFLGACEKEGLAPGRTGGLEALRSILSTGSPLEPRQFQYVYRAIKPDLQLASISGGTDIIGCFMLGNPLSPVYAGEIQGAALGVDIAALDEEGRPLTDGQGELVCRQPFPSMPVYFWNDGNMEKYRRAYFDHYPGRWRHGDFVTITGRGTVVVHGRSDATLNPGGVRIGTAEIYRIVEALPFIQDSIVVGHRLHGEDEIVLFVVMRPGEPLNPAREDELRAAIRALATPRHVPRHIRAIDEVPVTINGKKVELAVSGMLSGKEVKNREALANPAALEQFRSITF